MRPGRNLGRARKDNRRPQRHIASSRQIPLPRSISSSLPGSRRLGLDARFHPGNWRRRAELLFDARLWEHVDLIHAYRDLRDKHARQVSSRKFRYVLGLAGIESSVFQTSFPGKEWSRVCTSFLMADAWDSGRSGTVILSQASQTRPGSASERCRYNSRRRVSANSSMIRVSFTSPSAMAKRIFVPRLDHAPDMLLNQGEVLASHWRYYQTQVARSCRARSKTDRTPLPCPRSDQGSSGNSRNSDRSCR